MENRNLINDLKEHLKSFGYKSTKPRDAVLKAILEYSNIHFSAEEIYTSIRSTYPRIGLATVYRTLTLFEKAGIICRLNLDDGLNRYELNKPEENHRHHHLICTNCGNVTEFEDDLLDSLEEKILINNNFLVKDHMVKFYGLCETCRKSITT